MKTKHFIGTQVGTLLVFLMTIHYKWKFACWACNAACLSSQQKCLTKVGGVVQEVRRSLTSSILACYFGFQSVKWKGGEQPKRSKEGESQGLVSFAQQPQVSHLKKKKIKNHTSSQIRISTLQKFMHLLAVNLPCSPADQQHTYKTTTPTVMSIMVAYMT